MCLPDQENENSKEEAKLFLVLFCLTIDLDNIDNNR